MTRRDFLQQSVLASLAATAAAHLPLSLPAAPAPPAPEPIHYDLARHFPAPVLLDRVELRMLDDELGFLRLFTRDGAYGTVPVNNRLPYLHGILFGLVIPSFLGQDLRNLEQVVDGAYRSERNYKFSGMPLWNCIGHLELGALDLLGRLAGKPVHALLGSAYRERIPVYLTTFDRTLTVERTLEKTQAKLTGTGIQAVKLKIGGRMGVDTLAGRTDALIPAARKFFGDGFTLYADANGSFEVPEAIRVGKLLQDHGFAIYEEPVPYEAFEETRKVTQALNRVQVAGGEQDTSEAKFDWYLRHKGLHMLQPDFMYYGGFLRLLRLTDAAERYGIQVSPHTPREAALQAYPLHFAALTRNTGPYLEYNPAQTKLTELCEPKLTVQAGAMAVPTGPGWGFTFDETAIGKARLVTG